MVSENYKKEAMDEMVSSKIDRHQKYQFRILSEKQFQIGKKRLVILAKQCQKEKSKLVISMASLLVSFGG